MSSCTWKYFQLSEHKRKQVRKFLRNKQGGKHWKLPPLTGQQSVREWRSLLVFKFHWVNELMTNSQSPGKLEIQPPERKERGKETQRGSRGRKEGEQTWPARTITSFYLLWKGGAKMSQQCCFKQSSLNYKTLTNLRLNSEIILTHSLLNTVNSVLSVRALMSLHLHR